MFQHSEWLKWLETLQTFGQSHVFKKRQKTKSKEDKKESFVLWCQGSCALLLCFNLFKGIFLQSLQRLVPFSIRRVCFSILLSRVCVFFSILLSRVWFFQSFWAECVLQQDHVWFDLSNFSPPFPWESHDLLFSYTETPPPSYLAQLTIFNSKFHSRNWKK